jgi:hypothetical protein
VIHRPYSLRRRVRRLPFLPLGKAEGDGAPISASISYVRTFKPEGAAPLGAPSRRCPGSGPRFRRLNRAVPDRRPAGPASLAVSELLAGHPSVPGRFRPRSGVSGAYPETRERRALLHHPDAS